MGTAIAVIFYSLACLSLGVRLLYWLAPDWPLKQGPIVPMLGTGFLLGQGALAAVWQLVVVGERFSFTIVLIVLIVSLLSGLGPLRSLVIRLVLSVQSTFRVFWKESLVWKTIAVLALLPVITMMIAAAQPPQARGDALAFYLSFPKLVAATHRFVVVPGYSAFSQIGLQGEYHFAALMLMASNMAAKLFLVPTALGAAAMLSGIGQQVGLKFRGQVILLASLFTSTAFTNVIWDGKVDLFGAAMGVAAYYWALQVGTGPNNRPLWLAGLFTGLAMIAKFSYIMFLPASVLFLVCWRFSLAARTQSRSVKAWLHAFLPAIFMWGAFAFLPAISHLVKNAVVFHEPFAPFVSSDPQAAAITDQTWFSMETTKRIVISYPFAMSFGYFPMQGGQISVLLLAFAPLILLVPRPRSLVYSPLVQIIVSAALGVLIWLIARPSVLAPRYIMAPLLVLLILSARAAEQTFQLKPRLARIYGTVEVVLILVLLSFSGKNKMLAENSLNLIKGQIDVCDLESLNMDGSCRIAEKVAEAPRGERILLGSYFTYWLRPDQVQCLLSASQIALDSYASSEERWLELYKLGVQYVIIDQATHAYIDDRLDLTQVPDGLRVAVLFEQDSYLLYQIIPVDPQLQANYVCQETEPNIWQVVPASGRSG